MHSSRGRAISLAPFYQVELTRRNQMVEAAPDLGGILKAIIINLAIIYVMYILLRSNDR